MPRYPRNYLNSSFFHVMTQGINKSYIFNTPQDISYYINKINNLTKEHEIKVLAYCIMSNHAHILIKTNKINELSKYMQKLNTAYGKYYNQKYNKVGFVFRNRYKSQEINNEKHLYKCIEYIANNPVKAGICNSPEDYLYSKYPKFSKTVDEPYFFIDTNESNENLCQEVISKFLLKNNMDLSDLKNNKKELKDIIMILKNIYHFSLRKISMEIGLSKDTICRIYNR